LNRIIASTAAQSAEDTDCTPISTSATGVAYCPRAGLRLLYIGCAAVGATMLFNYHFTDLLPHDKKTLKILAFANGV
jgi:hypothetical protein